MSNMSKTYGEVANEIFNAVKVAEIKPDGKTAVISEVQRRIGDLAKIMFPEAEVITWFSRVSSTRKDRYFVIKFSDADTYGGIYFNYEVSLTIAKSGYRNTDYAVKSIRFKDEICDNLDKTMSELAQEQLDKSIELDTSRAEDLDARIAKAETTFKTIIEKMKKREPLTWEEAYDIESLLKKYKNMVN